MKVKDMVEGKRYRVVLEGEASGSYSGLSGARIRIGEAPVGNILSEEAEHIVSIEEILPPIPPEPSYDAAVRVALGNGGVQWWVPRIYTPVGWTNNLSAPMNWAKFVKWTRDYGHTYEVMT